MSRRTKTQAVDFFWETTECLHHLGSQTPQPQNMVDWADNANDFLYRHTRNLPLPAIEEMANLLKDAYEIGRAQALAGK